MQWFNIYGLAGFLSITFSFSMDKKISRILNDTGQDYVVQLRRYSKNNCPEYLCRSIHGFCLVDFSYEVNKNKIERVWYEHATRLENNIVYQLTMRPRDSFSILVFAKAKKRAEKLYSFKDLPYSISLSDLLTGKECSDIEPEKSEVIKIRILHSVGSEEYSPRISQKKLHRACL